MAPLSFSPYFMANIKNSTVLLMFCDQFGGGKDKYFSCDVLHSLPIMQFGSLTCRKPTLFCTVWPRNSNVAAGGQSYFLC